MIAHTLMSSPAAFDGVAIHALGSGPSLGSTHDNHRPPGLGDGLARSGSSLNLLNFSVRPFKRGSHVVVHIRLGLLGVGLVAESNAILDDAALVSVSGEQAGELFIVSSRCVIDQGTYLEIIHGAGDGPLSNLLHNQLKAGPPSKETNLVAVGM
jgi:hypothetical protein